MYLLDADREGAGEHRHACGDDLVHAERQIHQATVVTRHVHGRKDADRHKPLPVSPPRLPASTTITRSN